jgi:hypothetical protein
MNTFVSINENYLPINEFEKYLNFSKQINNWGNRDINNTWSGRVIYQNSIENFNYLKSVELKIKKEFQLSSDIYPDYLGIVKWETGDYQHSHADGELPDNKQHPYHWRDFGCVLYLNDDYEGGEIYFPNQNIEIKPKPNTLVFFPGTMEFLHGVKPITNGIRYTLTSFWTFNKQYNMNGYDSSSE